MRRWGGMSCVGSGWMVFRRVGGRGHGPGVGSSARAGKRTSDARRDARQRAAERWQGQWVALRPIARELRRAAVEDGTLGDGTHLTVGSGAQHTPVRKPALPRLDHGKTPWRTIFRARGTCTPGTWLLIVVEAAGVRSEELPRSERAKLVDRASSETCFPGCGARLKIGRNE